LSAPGRLAKPAPIPDADSLPFWQACRDRRLIAQRCDACGRWRWPPRGFCPNCASSQATWRDLSGTGVVQAYVVVHRAFDPSFAADVPYVIAHVALDGAGGNVVLVSNVIGTPWEDIRVGMPVGVVFDRLSEDVTLAKFQSKES
jgi:uncharacterized OB-fold protein